MLEKIENVAKIDIVPKRFHYRLFVFNFPKWQYFNTFHPFVSRLFIFVRRTHSRRLVVSAGSHTSDILLSKNTIVR